MFGFSEPYILCHPHLAQVPLRIAGMDPCLTHQPPDPFVVDQITQSEQVILHLQYTMGGMVDMALVHLFHYFQVFRALANGAIIEPRFADVQKTALSAKAQSIIF